MALCKNYFAGGEAMEGREGKYYQTYLRYKNYFSSAYYNVRGNIVRQLKL